VSRRGLSLDPGSTGSLRQQAVSGPAHRPEGWWTTTARLLRKRSAGISVGVGLGIFLAWTVLPIFYLGVLSVKPERIILDRPSLHFTPTFERYGQLLQWDKLGAPIANSVISASAGTAGAILLGSLAATAFALFDFRGKRLLFFTVVLTRLYPPMTTVIPVYLMLRTLGLLDTVAALAIVFTALQIPLVVWVMHTALGMIPREVMESAVLDGASLPVVLRKILWPLSGSGLITAAILSFIFCWNDFLLPLVVTSSAARTGTVAIMTYTETYRTVLWGPLSTVSIAMVAPTIVFMLALRTYLVKGLTGGMLKG
jgi:multiple sugar transport system permease protein